MADDLLDLGLSEGEAVRWRRHDGGHWQNGTVIGVERDGSIAVRDADGAWRSIVTDRLEAKRPNKRGRLVWQPLDEGSAQLSLWSTAPAPTPSSSTSTNGVARRSPRNRSTTLRPPLRAR